MREDLLLRGIRIDWDRIDSESYLREIPAVAGVSEMTFTNPVTLFVGENGTGKSTLLEAIAVSCGFNPEGGTRNYRFSTYDSHSELCEAISITWLPWKRSTAGGPAGCLSIFTKSPTGRVFWPWPSSSFRETACICWTSRRRPFRPSAS